MKRILSAVLFAAVAINGAPVVPLTSTTSVTSVDAINQPIVSSEHVMPVLSEVKERKEFISEPIKYVGLQTVQPILGEGVSGELRYSTAPIMEQLRSLSPDSNFGRLGAFTTAPILAQQANVFNEAIHGEAKPVPLSFTQPMIDAAMLSTSLPYEQSITAPVLSSFPQGKAVKPIKEFKFVNAPISNSFETLEVKELPTILQRYAVPSTFTTQENIKQPITQPVWQPYEQKYEQRAVPVVQPIVNRVLQPVIHRQLHPFLTSSTIQGQQEQAIINAPKVLDFNNQAIVGSEYDAKAMDDRSHVPSLPVMGASTDMSKKPSAVVEPVHSKSKPAN